jgi:hypothetical protein
MMTITNGEALSALRGLRALAEVTGIPIKGALRIRKVARILEELAADIEAERAKIAKQCCEVDEKGELIQSRQSDGHVVSPFRSPEAADEYRRLEKELLESTWEYEHTIRASDLGTKAEVLPRDLILLGELFEDDSESSTEN